MRNSKRIIALFCIIALMTVLFAACNQTPQQSSPSPSPAVADTTPNAEPDVTADSKPILGQNLTYDPNQPVNNGDAIEIDFWIPEDVKDLCEKYMAAYSELHPNVTFVQNVSPWDDYWQKLPLALSTGQGPDLFWMHNAYTDIMVPVTEPMPESVFPLDVLKKDFRQVDSHLIDGKLYYIDTGLMSSVVMYNKAMWAEAGLTEADIPKTWDALYEAAKKMTKRDDAGNIIVSGFSYNGENGFVNLVIAMNYQKGAFTFSQDGKSSILSNPTTIENMRYLQSWYGPEGIGDNKGDLNREALGQGKTAMICDWTWIPNYIAGTFPDVEIGIFPTPSFDGNPAAIDRNNGECSPCVSAQADDAAKAVAFDFVKYLLAGDDFLREFSMVNGIFPSKYSLDNDPVITASPVHQALSATIDKTLWVGALPGQIEEALGRYLQDDFLKNGVDAEQAAAKADQIITKDMEGLSFVPMERDYAGASAFKN